MATRQTSIEDLRVYTASRKLEDKVYELVRSLPQTEFYRLGNDLRRSSAAISHYISEAFRRHSIGLKIEALHLARVEVEQLNQHLDESSQRGYANASELKAEAVGVTKQLWGLIHYFRGRQASHTTTHRGQAVDELMAARG